MNTLVQSQLFSDWLRDLKDAKGRAHIVRRMARAELGNFGDCDSVGEGVSEMRIHYGPGYRIYFMRQGTTVYLLLCGGDKGSQSRDIEIAKGLARDLKGR